MMPIKSRQDLFLAATLMLVVSLLVARGFSRQRVESEPSTQTDSSRIRARQVEVYRPGKAERILLAMSKEGSPAIFVTGGTASGTIQAGLHDTGLPFVLAADGGIQNFGLGRADGYAESPILVFRTKDLVRTVIGLDMTNVAREPFAVYWTGANAKKLLFGTYCDADNRVCSR
jgi:hypothetical protein